MSIINDALKKVERDKKKASSQAPPPSRPDPVSVSSESLSRSRLSHSLSFRKSLVGIDIGFSSIKAVKLKRTGGTVSLLGAAYEKIPSGSKEKGISDALRSIVTQQKLENSFVASTINAKSLSLSQIKLPKMPASDLNEAVRWEVKKEIDFPDDAIIDYTVNDELIEDGKKKLLIQAFAVKKGDVLAHVELLKGLSLKPYAIDVCPMALLSAFDYNYGWEHAKRFAVIDIGASKTTLAIIHNKTLRLSRNIPIAGNDITWAIQDSEEIDFQTAEEKKLKFVRNLDDAPIAVQNAINRFMDDIAGEIERSFLYYGAQLREGAVDSILITGGCSTIPGLAGRIEKVVGIPTAVYDSMKGVQIKDLPAGITGMETLSPLLTEAFGLALRRKEA